MNVKNLLLMLVAIVLAAACTSAPGASGEAAGKASVHSDPFVVAVAQQVSGEVTIKEAFLDKPGYIVIHKVEYGKAGAVVGLSGLLEGDLHDVKVKVEGVDSAELIAMLHYDDGDSVYEFPGDDAPASHGDSIFITKFAVIKAEGEASATVDSAMPVPEADVGVEETVAVSEGEMTEIDVTAKQWEFSPETITVKKDSHVMLNVKSIDVAHGLAIPEFGVNERLEPGKTTQVEFVADKTGTFTFFCSVQCGAGHSDMKGTLVVE